MPYPQAVVVHVFIPPKKYQFVAGWPPELSDPKTVVARDDVAKEVAKAMGFITSAIVKGILEGFPEPQEIVAPDGKPTLKLVDAAGNEVTPPAEGGNDGAPLP